MAASVSYSFTNGNPTDGPQVSANFTDLVNFLNGSVVLKDASVAMTGILTLPASDPTTANQATRKSYVDASVAAAIPPGVLMAYGAASAPTGWLLCYGQAVSRSTYSGLFAVLSTTFGAGDASTTFNLPDLRGRVPIGLDNMGGVDAARIGAANTLGGVGGVSGSSADASTVGSYAAGDHAHNYVSPDYDQVSRLTTFNGAFSHDHAYFKPSVTADVNLPPFQLHTWIVKT